MARLQLQLLFSQTEEKQQNARILKGQISDALKNSKSYQEALEEVSALKDKLKQIEIAIKQDFVADLDTIDTIKADLEIERENMTAIALEKFKAGEEIIVNNKYGIQYEAEFTVKFKKTDKKPRLEMGME